MNTGVYLLWPLIAIKAKENVYKVGRSKNVIKRVSSYKDCVCLNIIPVSDQHKAERIILAEFGKRFKQRLDYGSEFFEGNHVNMINSMYELINSNDLFNKFENIESEDTSDALNTSHSTTSNNLFERNLLEEFCNDHLIRINNGFTTITKIYHSYTNWCSHNPALMGELKSLIIKKYGKETRHGINRQRGWKLKVEL